VLCLAFLIDRTQVALCQKIDQPTEDRSTLPPIPLLEIAFDGYLWNNHAETLGQDGTWRIRSTHFDNAPLGREVHWSSGFAWYLRGLGEIYRYFSGDSLRNSIYRMSIWANPILLVLALCLIPTLGAKRFGPLFGSVLAIAMITTPWFYEGFLPAYPDHHGITALALLGIVLGIVWAGAGWTQAAAPTQQETLPARSLKEARQGILLAGISAACALWISAFSACLMAAAIGFSTLTTVLTFRKKTAKENFSFCPELWQLWGTVAASGSFLFYLLEYFPNHLGMRLEINHPLYGLAWIGGTGILCEATRWLTMPTENQRIPWRRLLVFGSACLALPLTLWLGGPTVYLPRDPFLQGVLKCIAEVLPLTKAIALGALNWEDALGYHPFLLIGSLALLFDRHINSPTKAILLLLSCSILLIGGITLVQLRWAMLTGPLYIVLAGLLISTAWANIPSTPKARAPAALLLLILAGVAIHTTTQRHLLPVWREYRDPTTNPEDPGQLMTLLHRDIAKTLAKQSNGKPVTLLSSPNSSCLLASFGGFATIGTLYWENLDGLKTAAQIFSSTSEEETLGLLQTHGITHVHLMPWQNFLGPYFDILQGDSPQNKPIESTFGYKTLVKREFPQWLRPIPYLRSPLFDPLGPLNQNILLFEVVPNQTAHEATLHLLRYYRLQEGSYPPQAEKALKTLLTQAPKNLSAHLELAHLYLKEKRFEESRTQILTALSLANPLARAQICATFSHLLDFQGATAQAKAVRAACTHPNPEKENPK
jgi:hypothetical protein